MVIWFNPGVTKLQVAKAIKQSLGISIGNARDAVEIGRVECTEDQRDSLVKAIESAGAKLM